MARRRRARRPPAPARLVSPATSARRASARVIDGLKCVATIRQQFVRACGCAGSQGRHWSGPRARLGRARASSAQVPARESPSSGRIRCSRRGRMPAEPATSRAAHDAQQHGFGLIVFGVRRRDDVRRPPCARHVAQKLLACAPGGDFDGQTGRRDASGRHVDASRHERHCERAQSPARTLVLVALIAAHAVIEMQRAARARDRRASCSSCKQQQHRDGICATRERRDHTRLRRRAWRAATANAILKRSRVDDQSVVLTERRLSKVIPVQEQRLHARQFRTSAPEVASEVPNWCRSADSNRGPGAYETPALTS